MGFYVGCYVTHPQPPPYQIRYVPIPADEFLCTAVRWKPWAQNNYWSPRTYLKVVHALLRACIQVEIHTWAALHRSMQCSTLQLGSTQNTELYQLMTEFCQIDSTSSLRNLQTSIMISVVQNLESPFLMTGSNVWPADSQLIQSCSNKTRKST